VIQSLQDESKDITRIKRLLFYLCKYDLGLDTNDLTLKIAIQELQNLYPSLEALRIRMKQALTLINKPEYTAIMDVTIDELSAIYPVRSPHVTQSQVVTYIDTPTPNTPDYNFTLPVEPLTDQINQSLPSKERSEKSIDKQIAELDLFDLRLEIIKYLSPLRVKILIFSALNNVAESTNESISAIRTYELDDLLRDLFYAYKSPEKLETQLKITAKQFKDIDEYEQAATVIMSALMTVYKKLDLIKN
jgi:adenylate cyclase